MSTPRISSKQVTTCGAPGVGIALVVVDRARRRVALAACPGIVSNPIPVGAANGLFAASI